MKYFIILLFICFSFNSSFYSQLQKVNSMLGKRLYVDVLGTFNFNTFLNSSSNNWYVSKNDQSLVQKTKLFNTSYRAAVGCILDKRVSLALEVARSNEVFTSDYISYSQNVDNNTASETVTKHETIRMKTFTFMPKIEIFALGGLAPSGVSHQIGLGFSSSKPVDDSYLIEIDRYEFSTFEYSNFYKKTDSLFIPKINFKGLTFFYSLNYRKPLTKSILLNFGLNFTFNRINTNHNYSNIDEGYYIQESDLSFDVKKARGSNIISFKMGITFLIF